MSSVVATSPSLRRLTAPQLPAWPVIALMAGYPVWWLLGLGLFAPLLLALYMAALMCARGRVSLVPGVLPWLAFCLWLVPCALMLGDPMRLLGYLLRTAQFFAVAILLIYVVNARHAITVRSAMYGITWLWVGVVVGGYLGLLWPETRVTTVPGLLLPGSLAQDEFMRDLFFPAFAEVQQPWGAPEPFARPAAPFPYANNWGGTIALLTPVVLATIGMVRNRRVKCGLVVLLAASLVPISASSNRGMFLALAVSFTYFASRVALRGRASWLAGLVAVGALGLGFYLFGGGAESIRERQQYSESTESRLSLYTETLARTLESPLLGYGAPRPSTTVDVPAGTQGAIWQFMFSYGFVGLALFLLFLVGVVLRSWRAPGLDRLALHTSLVTMCVMIPYYGIHIAQMVVVVVVAGVLLRESPSWGPEARARRRSVRLPSEVWPSGP